MKGFLTSAGKLLLTTSGKIMLFSGAATLPAQPAPLLSTVTGMSAWWDAGTSASVLGVSGSLSVEGGWPSLPL